MKKSEVDISSLSAAAKDILERIGNSTQGLIKGIVEDFKELSAIDQASVLSVLLPKIARGEVKLYITREIFVTFEEYREKLCDALEKMNEKIQVGSIPSLKAMRNVDEGKLDNLLDVWLRTNTIDQKTVDMIKGRE